MLLLGLLLVVEITLLPIIFTQVVHINQLIGKNSHFPVFVLKGKHALSKVGSCD